MKLLHTLLGGLLLGSLALGGCKSDDGGGGTTTPPDTRKLHVASPDWSKQVIYFVLTDRFNDGDPANDDQGANEFDPTDARKYSGGDLKGVQAKLDYIQNLGATAVWITPPVANQWWDPLAEFGGYHGYWARHPKKVDEHLGTLDDYKNLSDALHGRGMYLIQDIVPNHVGNFFTYTPGTYDAANPATGYVANTQAVPSSAPELSPLDKNDPSNPDHRAAGIYHFTPPIDDYLNPVQEKTYQVSDLDDLATENPTVRALLRDIYGYWISEVGVDGFRVDTAKFIEPDFWHDFIYAPNDGLKDVAARTGRSQFLTFGEIYETSTAAGTEAEEKIRAHVGTNDAPGLDSGLAFPLFGTLGRVLGEGRPTEELAFRIQRMIDRDLVRNPALVPTFVDNHDVARFITRGGPDALTMGLRVIFTLPGIPVIYQGTEQALSETRPSMFAAGWGSEGKDHFDEASSTYKALKNLIALRKSSAVYTDGEVIVHQSSPAGAGVIAYERHLGDERALVVLNTSSSNALVTIDGGFAPGQRFVKKLGEILTEKFNADANGRLMFELAGRKSVILYSAGETDAVTPATATLTLDAPPPARIEAPWAFSGHVTGASLLKVVIDDDVAKAAAVMASQGTFSGTLALERFPYGDSQHTVTFYAPDAKVATARYTFAVHRLFDGVRVDFADPDDDDKGPAGNYRYPEDATFAHQMDIQKLTIEAGSTLSLIFQMRDHSTSWNPTNGFDHVCFNIFFELPGQTGGTNVMPLLAGTTPEGFTWTRNHFAFGWANNLRSAEGAAADTDGASVAGAPLILVSAADRTITFTYEKTPFGITDWTGVRIWAATWDYDGVDNRFRPITPDGGQWVFGGGDDTSPKIMDAIGPVTVPARIR